MLLIKALKIEINTTNGLYGTYIPFSNGLNIIRADNTSGKSTVFQSLIYALGFEELIGAKYEKTMQSVLKDTVLDGKKEYGVLQSAVLLQISNGTTDITIKRGVIYDARKSQLVDITYGPLLTEGDGDYVVKQMFLHDSGAATDETYGFHAYLEKFLNWKLPDVIHSLGGFVKLYLPLIAPAFVIEQKSGWSSFFATIPYYGIKNSEERVIEFILNLDVFKNEQKKILVNIDKKVIQDKWKFLYSEFRKFAEKGNAEVVGLDDSPSIINSISDIYLRVYRNEKYYLIPDLILTLEGELEKISNQSETTVGQNVNYNQSRLSGLQDSLTRINFRYEELESETLFAKEKLKQYIHQRKSIEEDLAKNKSAKKMLSLGGTIESSLAQSLCPTCGQEVKDSLLPAAVDQVPMQIDDNINFLTSQYKMIEIFTAGQRKKIIEQETLINDYKSRLAYIRQQIRSIKKDLVADDRLPSEELIERKVNTRRLIAFYSDMLDDVNEMKIRVKHLSDDWKKIKSSESELLGDFFSSLDRVKLTTLQESFLSLLDKFKYKSKDRTSIKISTEKYLPVIEVKLPNEKAKSYDIRFDSSGSDLIRCMWAYYIALMSTSIKLGGNHPRLLLFDEPQQQSASTDDFHQFLKELASRNDAQSIVFASFQNSLPDFNSATRGLQFNRIESIGKFITKVVK
jgi:hypothetical protein